MRASIKDPVGYGRPGLFPTDHMRTRNHKPTIILLVIGLTGVSLAACGGSDGASTQEVSVQVPPVTVPVTSTPSPQSPTGVAQKHNASSAGKQIQANPAKPGIQRNASRPARGNQGNGAAADVSRGSGSTASSSPSAASQAGGSAQAGTEGPSVASLK